MEMREMAMDIRARGEENNPAIDHQRNNRRFPIGGTLDGWAARLAAEGHIVPHEMTGNNPATVLKGHPLLMLTIYRLMYPKATAAEINAFSWNSTLPGAQYRFYSIKLV